MKNLVDIGVKVALVTAVVVLFVLQFQSGDSFVYVDSQKLMMSYNGMKDARSEFESKAAAWKANLDTLNMQVETTIRDYEAKKNKLSGEERRVTEELIRTKQQQYLNYEQVVQEKVQAEDKELSRKVMEKVNEYLKKYGKQKGYKIIFAATQYGNIVYAEDGIDVTDEVIKGLNAEYR